MEDTKLITKAKPFKRHAIVEQCLYTLELAKQHAPDLEAHGWTPAHTTELEAKTRMLVTGVEDLSMARSASRNRRTQE